MEYRVLGPLEVRVGDTSLPLGGAKQRALLALLVLNANQVVSRERLIDALWGEEPPETAVTTVQVYVSRLRKQLGSDALVTRSPGYLLATDSETIDLRRFERLVGEARLADPEGAGQLLREALALWRGPPLGEFKEPFARLEAGRLDDSRLAALEARLEADLALGRHVEVIGELEVLIAEQPHRERLRGQLIRALYRSGRQAEALEAYRNARAALDELGIEPSEELRQLEMQVLTQDAALARTRRTTNLPVQPTPLVGRTEELAEILELVRENSLVTLTGPGGSGKTRLALAGAAALADDFADGVWFVSLASLSDTELIESTIAQVLGESGDLNEFLRGKDVLLLLDNLEQLLPDVAEAVAGLEARVLATSRERLNLSAEHEYPVPTLPLAEAVELFIQRARQLEPHFQPDEHVPEIAGRLDGLPLALELAAARVKTLTPHQIVERLAQSLDFLTGGARDAPDRQQTLRTTLEWSYQLLDPQKRMLFGRLAVFVGGCTLEAAEIVCHANPDDLQSLIAGSLLRHRKGRYSMLQTIREFAHEELLRSDDLDATSRAHAEYFLAVAQTAARHLDTSEESAWFERLAEDHDNLRAALAYWTGSDVQLRLACALWRFWMRRGHHAEGRRWLEEALGATADAVTADTARGLRAAAAFARVQNDLEAAKLLASQSISVAERLGDRRLEAEGIGALSEIAISGRDYAHAAELLSEIEVVFGEFGDENRIAIVGANRSYLALQMGDFDLAFTLGRRALARSRKLGNSTNVVTAALNVALAANVLGERKAAIEAVVEALAVARSLRHRVFLADGLVIAAAILVTEDPDAAAFLVAAARSAREEMNVDLDPLERDLLASVEEQLDPSDGGRADQTHDDLDEFLDDAAARALEAFAMRDTDAG